MTCNVMYIYYIHVYIYGQSLLLYFCTAQPRTILYLSLTARCCLVVIFINENYAGRV